MELHWLSAIEWRRLIDQAGFEVAELYGWFDRRPYRGGEDMIWVCRNPTTWTTRRPATRVASIVLGLIVILVLSSCS